MNGLSWFEIYIIIQLVSVYICFIIKNYIILRNRSKFSWVFIFIIYSIIPIIPAIISIINTIKKRKLEKQVEKMAENILDQFNELLNNIDDYKKMSDEEKNKLEENK